MRPGDRGFGAALDRHITGNWGEDQYRDSEICDNCDDTVDCTEDPTTCKMRKKEEHLAEQADRAWKERNDH